MLVIGWRYTVFAFLYFLCCHGNMDWNYLLCAKGSLSFIPTCFSTLFLFYLLFIFPWFVVNGGRGKGKGGGG